MDGRYWQSGRGHNKACGRTNPGNAAILFDTGGNR